MKLALYKGRGSIGNAIIRWWTRSPFVRAALQEMVPGLLTQPQCDALLSRAQVPDPVSEFAVRLAIYNDDGSMKV